MRAVIDGEEQRRTYSICSGPDEPDLRIAIKRVVEGRFSNWANDTLAAGMRLEAMPPAGRFVLPESDGARRRVLAFAAGVGITPIIAMVKHALTREPNTSLTLVYGNDSLNHIYAEDDWAKIDWTIDFDGFLDNIKVGNGGDDTPEPIRGSLVAGVTTTVTAARAIA